MNDKTLALTPFDAMAQNPIESARDVGQMLAKSGMFGITTPEQGQVVALACICKRKDPFEILQTYHIVEGRLTMRADAMLAGYRNRGGQVRWKQFDDKAAVAEFRNPGEEPLEVSYTDKEAEVAGFIPAKPGSGWTKNRPAMLRARLISKALRMLMPEIVAGTYTPEEVADITGREIDVQATTTPDPEVQAKPSKGLDFAKAAAASDAAPAKPTEQAPQEPAKPAEAPPAKPATAAAQATAQAPAQAPAAADEDPNFAKVLEIVSGVEDKALAWMRKSNWLKEGQGLEALSAARLAMIVGNPEKFKAAISK